MTKPILRTALCDMLDIEYPVLLAGMGPPVVGELKTIAGPELVAAVSSAGGLGVLGGTGYTPEELEDAIRRIRALTDRPFGVDILVPATGGTGVPPALPEDPRALLPPEQRRAVDELRRSLGLPEARAELTPEKLGFTTIMVPDKQVEVVLDMRVPVLAIGLGDPGPFVEPAHRAGTKVISLVGNVANARRVAERGVDLVVAQGYEAGGHTGHIGTLALLPQVVDAVAPTPVIAAGGVGDGRALAAVLALGCVGAWCGTAFLASAESRLDDYRKGRVIEAAAEATRVTRLYSGKTMRNVTNELIEAWESSGMRPAPFGLQGVLIADMMAAAEQAGRRDLLMNAAGQVSGMVTRVRPAREILEEMVAEAVEILVERLPARVRASRGA